MCADHLFQQPHCLLADFVLVVIKVFCARWLSFGLYSQRISASRRLLPAYLTLKTMGGGGHTTARSLAVDLRDVSSNYAQITFRRLRDVTLRARHWPHFLLNNSTSSGLVLFSISNLISHRTAVSKKKSCLCFHTVQLYLISSYHLKLKIQMAVKR